MERRWGHGCALPQGAGSFASRSREAIVRRTIRASAVVDLGRPDARWSVVVLDARSGEVHRAVGDPAVCARMMACWPFQGAAHSASLGTGLVVGARRAKGGFIVMVASGLHRLDEDGGAFLLDRLVELIEGNPGLVNMVHTALPIPWNPEGGDGGTGAPALIAAHTPRRAN